MLVVVESSAQAPDAMEVEWKAFLTNSQWDKGEVQLIFRLQTERVGKNQQDSPNHRDTHRSRREAPSACLMANRKEKATHAGCDEYSKR